MPAVARSSVFIQYIYDDLDFESPFMLTFLANSLLGLYIPLWQLWICMGLIHNPPPFSSSQSEEPVTITFEHINSVFHDIDESDHNCAEHSESLSQTGGKSCKIPQYSHMDVLRAAIHIAPVWFIANCLYNYSLYMTSVSSSTIIR